MMAVAEPARQLAVQLRPQRETAGSGGTVSVLSANLWHDWPRFRQLGNGRYPFVRRLALSADAMTEIGRLALFSVHLSLLPHHNTWRVTEAQHLDAPGGAHSDHRAVLLRLKANLLEPGFTRL